MVRSLWTAASGMNAMQFKTDTIAHNLSNVNTTGYKKSRADFEDLLYQTMRTAGTPATEDTVVPTGIQVGLGVKTAATQKMFEQGSLQATSNPLDVAIEGEGFFRVTLPDGTEAYTRDGSFKLDANGTVVNSNGYPLDTENGWIVIPDDFQSIQQDLTITPEGLVTIKLVGDPNEDVEFGQITLTRFINPAGLMSIGENLYKESAASGVPVTGNPTEDGQGKLHHKFIEMSNVKVVDEMVDMIVAQRAYEMNSKAIITTDTMLGTVVSLKR